MAIFADRDDKTIQRTTLLVLRIYLGLFYLQTGYNKIDRGDWGRGYAPNVREYVEAQLSHAYSFYAGFLEHVVAPNADLFAMIVSWGEFLLGLALLIGIFTRLASVMGIILNLNFTFAMGRAIYYPGFEALIIWVLLTFVIAPPGRVAGLDMVLQERFPRFWRWLQRFG